jgi:hypothetical protein
MPSLRNQQCTQGGEKMATKTTRVKKSPSAITALTAKDVMNKHVHYAHLKTKDDGSHHSSPSSARFAN